MKLWLQVLFAHGYLWRERFPDLFGADAHLRGERPSLWQIAFGVFFLVAAIGNAVASLWERAAIFLFIGMDFAFPLVGLTRVNRLFGDAALWVSLSWATGVLALAGILVLIGLSLITGAWWAALLFLAFLALPAAPTINGILSRYLFFADPRANAHWLEDHPIESARSFWVETCWRLPREVAQAMFHRPKAPA